MTQQDIQELTRPRIKVIADYPGSQFKVGEVLEQVGTGNSYEKNGSSPDAGWGPGIEAPDKYPSVVRFLGWWEEREPDELPVFVKVRPGIAKGAVPGHPTLSPGDVFTYIRAVKLRVPMNYVWPTTPEEFAAFEAANE